MAAQAAPAAAQTARVIAGALVQTAVLPDVRRQQAPPVQAAAEDVLRVARPVQVAVEENVQAAMAVVAAILPAGQAAIRGALGSVQAVVVDAVPRVQEPVVEAVRVPALAPVLVAAVAARESVRAPVVLIPAAQHVRRNAQQTVRACALVFRLVAQAARQGVRRPVLRGAPDAVQAAQLLAQDVDLVVRGAVLDARVPAREAARAVLALAREAVAVVVEAALQIVTVTVRAAAEMGVREAVQAVQPPARAALPAQEVARLHVRAVLVVLDAALPARMIAAGTVLVPALAVVEVAPPAVRVPAGVVQAHAAGTARRPVRHPVRPHAFPIVQVSVSARQKEYRRT